MPDLFQQPNRFLKAFGRHGVFQVPLKSHELFEEDSLVLVRNRVCRKFLEAKKHLRHSLPEALRTFRTRQVLLSLFPIRGQAASRTAFLAEKRTFSRS